MFLCFFGCGAMVSSTAGAAGASSCTTSSSAIGCAGAVVGTCGAVVTAGGAGFVTVFGSGARGEYDCGSRFVDKG